MERKTKIIIGIIIGVVVVGGTATGIYFYNKNKNKKGGDGNSGGGSTPSGGGVESGGAITSDETTSTEKETSTSGLKVGAKGTQVGMFQTWLNWKYNAGITVDGRYGTTMRDAVRKYLKLNCNRVISDDDCNLLKFSTNLIRDMKANPKLDALVKSDFKKLKSIYK